MTERYRDILKQGIFKHNNQAGFLFIGAENQTAIHFAMPIRSMLYDSLTYDRQIFDTARKHRRKSGALSGGEFLSGFTREDRLVPVVTLVVNFGQEPWTAPCRLYEMLDATAPEILSCISDYHINLIDPHRMTEEDFQQFETTLQYVMRFIGASGSRDGMQKLLHDFEKEYAHMERDAAELLKVCTKIDIKIKKDGGGSRYVQSMGRDEGRMFGERIGAGNETRSESGKGGG